MKLSRREALKGAAGVFAVGTPLVLTIRKAQAQSSFLSSSLIQRINNCALQVYQSTPDAVADPLDALAITLNDFPGGKCQLMA